MGTGAIDVRRPGAGPFDDEGVPALVERDAVVPSPSARSELTGLHPPRHMIRCNTQ